MPAAVPEKMRVTMVWLEWTATTGQHKPHLPPAYMACRPLQHPVPIASTDTLR